MSRSASGTVIVSYDDGDICDHQRAFPVHQKHGVPAEVGIVSGYVGLEGRLARTHLLEMQYSGWEVVSHTKHHIGLGEEAVAREARAGERKLYIANHRYYKPGVELELRQGNLNERVRVVERASDSLGDYLLLEKGLAHDYRGTGVVARKPGLAKRGIDRVFRLVRSWLKFSGEIAWLRVSTDQAQAEIKTSREELVSMGLNVRHFTYPYNRYCPWTRDLVSRHYETARAGGSAKSPSDRSDRYSLPGVCFEEDRTSDEEIRQSLEATQQTRGLCILFAHPRNRTFSEARLERILLTCKSMGLVISTRSAYFSGARSSRL